MTQLIAKVYFLKTGKNRQHVAGNWIVNKQLKNLLLQCYLLPQHD